MAYNNEGLFLDFIKGELCLVLYNAYNFFLSPMAYTTHNRGLLAELTHKGLLLIVIAEFYTTESVLEKLHSA